MVIRELANVTRPTHVHIDTTALLHNVNYIKRCAPQSRLIAMVKANAYGCGLAAVVPALDGHVDAFGVACIEEAMVIRALGVRSDCVLFQGVFSAEEFHGAAVHQFQCVIHQAQQLQWLLANPLPQALKIWVKVNTGMHRLGFEPSEVYEVVDALTHCPWVHTELGLMTHLACADEPCNPANQQQLQLFNALSLPRENLLKSIANSAAILSLPSAHADAVRPGIMLYGVSPFMTQTGRELGLVPVMRFISTITAVHHYPAGASIGYGGTWQTRRASVIGVVPVGYGDGYPRHIAHSTPLWVNGVYAPIVGRVSMDMLTVDLTDCMQAHVGDLVELWGQYVPVEHIATSAGTIPYELLCQFSSRVGR